MFAYYRIIIQENFDLEGLSPEEIDELWTVDNCERLPVVKEVTIPLTYDDSDVKALARELGDGIQAHLFISLIIDDIERYTDGHHNLLDVEQTLKDLGEGADLAYVMANMILSEVIGQYNELMDRVELIIQSYSYLTKVDNPDYLN